MSAFITTAPPQTRAEALGRRAVAMIGIATLAAVAVIAFAGFGSEGRAGPLGWTGKTEVFTHPTIKDDRVLTGTLRNDGTHAIRVDIGKVRLLAADGTTVPSAPVFLKASGKRLWSAGRGPQTVPDTELLRTGRIALLSPGEEVPLDGRLARQGRQAEARRLRRGLAGRCRGSLEAWPPRIRLAPAATSRSAGATMRSTVLKPSSPRTTSPGFRSR